MDSSKRQEESRSPTQRLYWEDDHCLAADAEVVGLHENRIAFNRTCFFPGGGGQPHDTGNVRFPDGREAEIVSASADVNEVIWHIASEFIPYATGCRVRLIVNRHRRATLSRYHTVLHILNTITLRDFGGWITGVQIGMDYSRIDFKLDRFSVEKKLELEEKVNVALEGKKTLRSFFLPEEEFRARTDLLRTLDAKPPVINGRVRIVEIQGFDAQACGGTHVSDTSEVGRFHIFKTENKGKINKRFYVRLDEPS